MKIENIFRKIQGFKSIVLDKILLELIVYFILIKYRSIKI